MILLSHVTLHTSPIARYRLVAVKLLAASVQQFVGWANILMSSRKVGGNRDNVEVVAMYRYSAMDMGNECHAVEQTTMLLGGDDNKTKFQPIISKVFPAQAKSERCRARSTLARSRARMTIAATIVVFTVYRAFQSKWVPINSSVRKTRLNCSFSCLPYPSACSLARTQHQQNASSCRFLLSTGMARCQFLCVPAGVYYARCLLRFPTRHVHVKENGKHRSIGMKERKPSATLTRYSLSECLVLRGRAILLCLMLWFSVTVTLLVG